MSDWPKKGSTLVRGEDYDAIQDKLSIALSANHDLRDERDRLTDRLAEAEAKGQHYDCNVAILTKQRDTAEARLAEAEAARASYGEIIKDQHDRLAQAEALLRGTEGYPMPWDWLERRDAFLAQEIGRNS